MTLRRRLEKLEEDSPESATIDWQAVARGDFSSFPKEDPEAKREAIERHPNAILLREEYDRRGIAQPASLVNVDLIGEILRLAKCRRV